MEDSKSITKKIVMRYARGNGNLMRGYYATQEDIDKERQEVLELEFKEKSIWTGLKNFMLKIILIKH